jgi:capsular polysaccharide export protein
MNFLKKYFFRNNSRHRLLPSLLHSLKLSPYEVQAGWGYRPSGKRAIYTSKQDASRLLLLEDAFVRSLMPGSACVYGLVADSRGIYYDASGKSDIITALNEDSPSAYMKSLKYNDSEIVKIMGRFAEIGASKYNWYPAEFDNESPTFDVGVMVVDQTRGDTALRYGGVSVDAFDRMVTDALDEHPGLPVYLRAHPDHRYRKKNTCFSPWVFNEQRIRILPPDLPPASCFKFCREIYTATSLMGMEALIHGCRVNSYGWNFYTGWGLTIDRSNSPAPLRLRYLSLLELFEAAYLRYCHYFCPDTGEPCGFEEILDHLALQKEMFRENRGNSVTVGFTRWNRLIAAEYLRSPAGTLTQINQPRDADWLIERDDTRVLVWGCKAEFSRSMRDRVVRVEDGFLRSKGLGASFNFPYSWVLDKTGIYFDQSQPSDLEDLFNKGFDQAELTEARKLIDLLRERRITKYNLTDGNVAINKEFIGARKVILIPGQVDKDASILYGSPEVKSNLELLLRVRAAYPDAFLIFKPHPDLVAGTRHGHPIPDGLGDAADLVVTEGNVLDWLDLCDEVHTMTSTVGFEALIREVPVVTYGMPFYAAWGLTTDRLKCTRRQRRLTLDELVCGALVKYPRYLNPATGEFTTALKVTRLLTADTVAGDRRAWHLKTVSILKKAWVKISRF